MTHAGVVPGTAWCMSPERAKGRVVDRRADIWAFGCVLFEMLTGTRAFPGPDVMEVLVSILRDERPGSALPRGTPPHVRSLLQRCPVPAICGRASASTCSISSTALVLVRGGARRRARSHSTCLHAGPARFRAVPPGLARAIDHPAPAELLEDGPEGGAAHLISAERATLVRDYLLSRFRRRANLTGVVAMGSQAPGSPSGDDRWSGVALTLFVDATTLSR